MESGRQVTREKSEGRNPSSAYSGVAATRLYAVLIRGSDFFVRFEPFGGYEFFRVFCVFHGFKNSVLPLRSLRSLRLVCLEFQKFV
jgi:hypothetical protein